jgi:hypothetical protein
VTALKAQIGTQSTTRAGRDGIEVLHERQVILFDREVNAGLENGGERGAPVQERLLDEPKIGVERVRGHLEDIGLSWPGGEGKW